VKPARRTHLNPQAREDEEGRVQSIFGGTTEIMKEIVGRHLGL
jgi:hypothetical protein